MTIRAVMLVVVAALSGLMLTAARAQDGGGGGVAEGRVRVAMLTYGTERKSSVCFADHFLRDVAIETEIHVDRRFTGIDLGSEDLFVHPFAVMTGEGSFELTEQEIANARRYLTSGGFLLASSGCSNSAWNASMKRALEQILPDAELEKLEMTHEVFHTIYDIKRLDAKRRSSTPEIFGNEIRNASDVNANILAYALTR